MVVSQEIIEEMKEHNKVYLEIDNFLNKSLKEGVKYIDIVEGIENIIFNRGLELAFPVNFSINEIAAHDTPSENDIRTLKEGDVLKVDVGVHKNGYIIDTAKTYVIGNNDRGQDLNKTSERIIKEITKSLYVGMPLREVGEIVEGIASASGYGIITNLTGHNLGRYIVHGGLYIPNIKNNIKKEIEHGDMLAIEPFIVSLPYNVQVKDHSRVEIYQLIQKNKNVRDKFSAILLREIREKYGTGLPFSKRSLSSLKGFMKDRALRILVNEGILYSYPVLYVPYDGALVAQREITLYVGDKIEVLGFKF